jgi:hypothetical protein
MEALRSHRSTRCRHGLERLPVDLDILGRELPEHLQRIKPSLERLDLKTFVDLGNRHPLNIQQTAVRLERPLLLMSLGHLASPIPRRHSNILIPPLIIMYGIQLN